MAWRCCSPPVYRRFRHGGSHCHAIRRSSCWLRRSSDHQPAVEWFSSSEMMAWFKPAASSTGSVKELATISRPSEATLWMPSHDHRDGRRIVTEIVRKHTISPASHLHEVTGETGQVASASWGAAGAAPRGCLLTAELVQHGWGAAVTAWSHHDACGRSRKLCGRLGYSVCLACRRPYWPSLKAHERFPAVASQEWCKRLGAQVPG